MEVPFSQIIEVARRGAKQLVKKNDAAWLRTSHKNLIVNNVFQPVALLKQGDGKTFHDLKDVLINAEKSDTKRILFKSGPGHSKTIICEQILWYWLGGMLSGFPIVFLASLKPSNKDKDIGDIIMEQYPMFEGSGITKQQVLGVLENPSSSILLLIDGFENENVDAQKIVRQQKFSSCNVFVTSRPHSVANYEKEFDTVFVSKRFLPENKLKRWRLVSLRTQVLLMPL